MEQQLIPVIKGEYKNLNLKSNKLKNIVGLEDGNHIIVTKLFDTTIELNGQWGVFYSAKVRYGNDEVSFLLNKKENEAFNKAGVVEEKVKIMLHKELIPNPKTGIESVYQRLTFEKVE